MLTNRPEANWIDGADGSCDGRENGDEMPRTRKGGAASKVYLWQDGITSIT